MRDLFAEALERAMQIQSESVGRLQDGESGGAEVLARLTVMLYEGAGTGNT